MDGLNARPPNVENFVGKGKMLGNIEHSMEVTGGHRMCKCEDTVVEIRITDGDGSEGQKNHENK